MIHLGPTRGKGWMALLQNGYNHLLLSAAPSTVTSLAKTALVLDGSPMMIQTTSRYGLNQVQWLSKIWSSRLPSSTTILSMRRWYQAQNPLLNKTHGLWNGALRPFQLQSPTKFLNKLRRLFVDKYVTNVPRLSQLLSPLKLLMLFIRKYVTNKHMKANSDQRLSRQLLKKNAVWLKENVSMLLQEMYHQIRLYQDLVLLVQESLQHPATIGWCAIVVDPAAPHRLPLYHQRKLHHVQNASASVGADEGQEGSLCAQDVVKKWAPVAAGMKRG